MKTHTKALWLACLLILPACVSEPVDSTAPLVKAALVLPFHVAILPIASYVETGKIDMNAGATALAEILQDEVFVRAAEARSVADAVEMGAEWILLAEANRRTSGELILHSRFYDADSFEASGGTGSFGLALSIETPFPVETESLSSELWGAVASEVVKQVRARSDQLLNPGLTPFQLVMESIQIEPLSAGLRLSGEVRFAPESRTQHLRQVRLHLPDGTAIEANSTPSASGIRSASFTAELPALASGESIRVELVAGSRVHYRRHYVLLVP